MYATDVRRQTKASLNASALTGVVSEMTYTVSSGTLNPTIPYHTALTGRGHDNAQNNSHRLYLHVRAIGLSQSSNLCQLQYFTVEALFLHVCYHMHLILLLFNVHKMFVLSFYLLLNGCTDVHLTRLINITYFLLTYVFFVGFEHVSNEAVLLLPNGNR